MTAVWCELAFVDGRPQPAVAIDIEDGRFTSVTVGIEPGQAVRLPGFTIPGLANAHSHAFHRALRSRTQAHSGTFWTWRDLMYRAADRLDPDSYFRLARAVFAEMTLAGVSCVGEFHYLHHQPDGTPYSDPNAMGVAVLAAARDAGVRITLLDTVYLHGGLDGTGHSPPAGAQRRFSDGTADAWIERIGALAPTDSRRIGAAIHSVRAVDPAAMTTVAGWSSDSNAVVHAHVSEQAAENESCVARHGCSPMSLLAEAGVVNDRFTAVHATHVDASDVAALASAGSTVAMCPTTERDLGDGIGPTGVLAAADVPMALGSDSHAVIDLFEEASALELHERLRSRQRGVHRPADLLTMATVNGHRSLGWDDAGSIEVGNRADLVAVDLESVRTAGTTSATAVESVVFAATSSDITDVFVDGRRVVAHRRHVKVDVASELGAAIGSLLDDD